MLINKGENLLDKQQQKKPPHPGHLILEVPTRFVKQKIDGIGIGHMLVVSSFPPIVKTGGM